MADMWNIFAQYLKLNYKCCLLKELNSEPNKQIFVAKICNIKSINIFYKTYQSKQNLVDTLYLDPNTKFVIMAIPKSTKFLVNLFCCNLSMENIYSRLSTHGIAIEGCFKIQSKTNIPKGEYSGFDPQTKKSFIKKNKIIDNYASYLVIDNYQIIKILDENELSTYKTTGINTQYVQGRKLFENSQPIIPINQMKNVIIENIPDLPKGKISGENVIIDYSNLKLKLKINNIETEIDFNKIGSEIKFEYEQFFILKSILVIAIDINSNILMFYHPKIDYFNMALLLQLFNIKDAIAICFSPNAHIIWKEAGLNTYNKTDFIGNTTDNISNVITFSS